MHLPIHTDQYGDYGIVQLYNGTDYLSICATMEDWGDEEASAVCRQLGLEPVDTFLLPGGPHRPLGFGAPAHCLAEDTLISDCIRIPALIEGHVPAMCELPVDAACSPHFARGDRQRSRDRQV